MTDTDRIDIQEALHDLKQAERKLEIIQMQLIGPNRARVGMAIEQLQIAINYAAAIQ